MKRARSVSVREVHAIRPAMGWKQQWQALPDEQKARYRTLLKGANNAKPSGPRWARFWWEAKRGWGRRWWR